VSQSAAAVVERSISRDPGGRFAAYRRFVIFSLLLESPLIATATPPITVSTDLNPGDPYRLAFLTSTRRDA
jgi:hypothetical protein